MKRIISVIAAAVCLTSCAKGFKPIEKKGETDNVHIEGNLQYGTLEEARADFQSILSVELDRITLPESLNMDFPEKLTGFKIHEPMLDKQSAAKIYNALSAYDNKDELKWNEDDRIVIENDNGYISNRWLVQLDNGNEHFFSEKEGLVAYTSGDAQNIYDLAGAKRPDEPLFSNADPNEMISLIDSEASVSQISSLAQSYADDYSTAADSMKIKPYSYDTTQDSGVIVNYELDIEGWSFGHFRANTSSNMCQNEDMFGGKSGSIANAEISSIDKVDGFQCLTNGTEIMGNVNESDKMVLPSSALKYVDENLAEHLKVELLSMSLIQNLDSNADNSLVGDKLKAVHNGSEMTEEEVFSEDYQTYPCYEFILRDKDDHDRFYIVLLNCENGEFGFAHILY